MRRGADSAVLAVFLILIDGRFIPCVYAARAAVRLERLWESTVLDQSMNMLSAVRNAFDRFQFFKNEKSHWVPQRCEMSHREAWHNPDWRKLADVAKGERVKVLITLKSNDDSGDNRAG